MSQIQLTDCSFLLPPAAAVFFWRQLSSVSCFLCSANCLLRRVLLVSSKCIFQVHSFKMNQTVGFYNIDFVSYRDRLLLNSNLKISVIGDVTFLYWFDIGMIVFVVHGSQNGLRRIRFLSPWDHKLIISLSQDRVSLSRESDFTGFIRAVSWARCSVGWLLDFQSNPCELFMSLCHLLLECFPNSSHVRVPWLTRQLSSFSCDNDKWKKQHKKKTNHASTAVLGFLWWWDEHLTACFWCWCGSPLCASLPFHHEAQLHITMHEYILRMRIIDPHGGELYIHLLYSIRRSEVRIRGSSWKSSVFFKDILLRILSFTIRKLHKWRYFSTDVSTEILNLIFATL